MGDKPTCLCGKCKTCIRRGYSRTYAAKNRELLNAKRRQWRAENPGVDAARQRASYRAEPEKWRAYWREHNKSPEYEKARYERRKQEVGWIEKKREYMRRYREQYAEHAQAQAKLQDAVRTGKIMRGPCEVCGQPGGDGHHEDYTKPFAVRWLCRSHHRQLHIARSAA